MPIYSHKGFRTMPKYALRGTPDINLIHRGHYIGIEVKTEDGVLSKHQLVFQECCRQNGATYIVARSLEDVTALFEP